MVMDAWKALEGMGTLEAKHRYVDTLLRAATEAYKANAGRAQAQKILQTFANLRSSGDDESTTDDLEDDGKRFFLSGSHLNSPKPHPLEELSAGSADEEEQAYLRQIQQSTSDNPPRGNSRASFATQSTRVMRTAPSPSSRLAPPRAASVTSAQSMATAPTTVSRRRLSQSTEDRTALRPRSAASTRSGPTDRISFTMSRSRIPPLLTEDFDDSVDPWAQQYGSQDSEDSIDEQDITSGNRPRKFLRVRRQRSAMASPVQHPHYGSSTSSTITAAHRQQRQQQPQRRFIDPPYNAVALGPAAKQALEALQSEIVALNERVDGLKQQIERSQQVSNKPPSSTDSEEDDNDDDGSEIWEGWRWVIKRG
ncbi:hypothetical protein EC973_000644 [Apophysomyces ossiformis]|uniref:ACB domain-containing protein n=1 Tax=Apophysomyces ossiformis TaxID=679940 RepID=A0A8H7EU31_9FUNG|nr:hypothetical protein EC973_000644 [Apophysomyces ossiformis]